jgi:general stress protein 26
MCPMNDNDMLCTYAESLLKKCEEVHIASVDTEGYPRVCIVSPVKTEGYGVIWFVSPVSSEKVRQFRENPKAGVCYGFGNDIQVLTGIVAFYEDADVKRSLWKDWLTNWFPGGPDDPGMCAVKFTAQKATLWQNGNTVTFTV